MNDFLKPLKVLSLSLCLVGLAACGSNKLPPAPLQDFKPAASLTRLWSVDLPAALNAEPSVYDRNDGGVLLASYGSDVAAYKASTGALSWRANLAAVQAPLSLSADGRTVLALVQGVEAVGLDAGSGEVRWRSALPAEMRTQAASLAGMFVVLTADGRIVGLDEQTGRRRWALVRSLPALSVRGSGAVAPLTASIMAVGLPGGKAIGVNVSNGQVVWETNLAQSRGVNEVERIADVLPDWVSVPNAGLCATSYRQRAACLDSKGQISYAQEMNALTGLVANDQQLFALDEDGAVKAWRVKNSASESSAPDWRFDGLKGRTGNTYSALASASKALYAHDNLGYLHVLSANSGQLLARASTGLGKDAYLAAVRTTQTLFASAESTLSAWRTISAE